MFNAFFCSGLISLRDAFSGREFPDPTQADFMDKYGSWVKDFGKTIGRKGLQDFDGLTIYWSFFNILTKYCNSVIEIRTWLWISKYGLCVYPFKVNLKWVICSTLGCFSRRFILVCPFSINIPTLGIWFWTPQFMLPWPTQKKPNNLIMNSRTHWVDSLHSHNHSHTLDPWFVFFYAGVDCCLTLSCSYTPNLIFLTSWVSGSVFFSHQPCQQILSLKRNQAREGRSRVFIFSIQGSSWCSRSAWRWPAWCPFLRIPNFVSTPPLYAYKVY